MIEDLAKFFGGSAILIAGLSWIARALIKHFFNKDLERFKAKIEHQSHLELQKIGHDLRLAALEHQYRAAALLDRRATVTAELYRLLQEFVRAAGDYADIVGWSGEPSKDEKAQTLAEKASEFQRYYLSNKIYFPRALCESIDGLWSEVIGPISNYSFWRKREAHYETSARRADESWSAAYNAMQNKVPPLLESIEDEFRSLIGVTRTRP